MNATSYRFVFARTLDLSEAEQSLHLAMFAVEGLFGQARVRLEAAYEVIDDQRAITVDGATEVGAAIVKVYTGLLLREFGADAFRVHLTESNDPEPVAVSA